MYHYSHSLNRKEKKDYEKFVTKIASVIAIVTFVLYSMIKD